MHQIFITMKVINFAKQNTIVNQYVAELGYRAFCTKGVPATVHLCCVIAVQKGVDYIKKAFSRHDNIMLWCATIAPDLHEHSSIVPCMGDSGDLAYGEKI